MIEKRIKLVISLIIFLWLTVFIVTPFEARLMNADLTWMWILNIKEAAIFTFGLIIGMLVYKN